MSKLVCQVRTEVDGPETRIYTPYNPNVVAHCRAASGRWDRTLSAWVLRSEFAAPVITKLFGDSEDLVLARVHPGYGVLYDLPDGGKGWRCQHKTGKSEGVLYCGGYTLASRSGRQDPIVSAGVTLVEGGFERDICYTRKPQVETSKGTVFQLAVRADFAETHGLDLVGAEPVEYAPPSEDTGPDLRALTDAELYAELDRRLSERVK